MSNKTLRRGFGVVRYLTPDSRKTLSEMLHFNDAKTDEFPFSRRLKRREPAHATIIRFIKMTRREQATFQAGFSVSRLEEKLERNVQDVAPRVALTVDLGAIASIGSFLYAEIEDDQLTRDQTAIAGQVAMHGINIQKINKKILPPHLGIGFNQFGPIEETREALDEILPGQAVSLERWRVYPDRYA